MENKSRGHNKKSRIKRWFKAFSNDWQWIRTEQHKEVIAAERTQEEIRISTMHPYLELRMVINSKAIMANRFDLECECKGFISVFFVSLFFFNLTFMMCR